MKQKGQQGGGLGWFARIVPGGYWEGPGLWSNGVGTRKWGWLMGILEELGLTEEGLNTPNHPTLASDEGVSGEEVEEGGKGSLTSPILLEEEDFLRKIREGKFDTPEYPMHPDMSDTDTVIDSIVSEATKNSGEMGVIQKPLKGKMEGYPVTGEVTLSGSEDPTPKKSKSKRVAYSVACVLRISGSEYQVQLLPPSEDYDKAYRLNKMNAQKPVGYNVTQVDGEILCECADYRYRQDGTDSRGCKHIRGLVDLGMFAAPSSRNRVGSSVFDD